MFVIKCLLLSIITGLILSKISPLCNFSMCEMSAFQNIESVRLKPLPRWHHLMLWRDWQLICVRDEGGGCYSVIYQQSSLQITSPASEGSGHVLWNDIILQLLTCWFRPNFFLSFIYEEKTKSNISVWHTVKKRWFLAPYVKLQTVRCCCHTVTVILEYFR